MRDISRTIKDREKGGRNTEGRFRVNYKTDFFISVGLKCKMLGMA